MVVMVEFFVVGFWQDRKKMFKGRSKVVLCLETGGESTKVMQPEVMCCCLCLFLKGAFNFQLDGTLFQLLLFSNKPLTF
jgi:hypothetical protein